MTDDQSRQPADHPGQSPPPADVTGPPPATAPPPPPEPDAPTVVGMPTDPGQPPASRGGPPTALLVGIVVLLAVGFGVLFALQIGPFASAPSPTMVDRPTTAPATAPTSAPTAQPTEPEPTRTPSDTPSGEPTSTPLDTAPPGDFGAQLLTHVPAPIAPTCETSAGAEPILAVATCSADDGAIEIAYFLYDSDTSMSQTYEGYRLVSGIEPSSGRCSDPATWPAENGYTIGDQPAGRWLCTEALGEATIYWTDTRLNILSQATHTTSDYTRLVAFWERESGPDL